MKVDENTFSNLIRSLKFLTDGNSTLWESVGPDVAGDQSLVTARLYKADDQYYSFANVPFDLGRPAAMQTIFRDLNSWKAGSQTSSVKLVSFAPSTEAGREGLWELVTRRQSLKAKESRETIYWIDRGRGSIPVEQKNRTDSLAVKRTQFFFLQGLHEIRGRGWLPFKLIRCDEHDHTVHQDEFLSVDFDKPPADSLFVLKSEKPPRIDDQILGIKRLETDRFDLSHFPAIEEEKKARP